MTDVLSFFVSGQITQAYIKKIYELMRIVVICYFIYSVIDLAEWYILLKDVPMHSRLSHPFYRYTLRPIISIIEISMDLIVNVLAYQAWGNLQTSIETSDDVLLNKAFKTFYNMVIIALTLIIISILNSLYRNFFL
ncbi:MAG TPA: hypothetical protein VIJ92_01005 [Ginsengibacter sp.]